MRAEFINGEAHLIMTTDRDISRIASRLASTGIDDEVAAQLDEMIPLVPQQPALFELNQTESADESKVDKAFPADLTEWARGQEAGYRGDELVGDKSHDFKLGYNAGQASRINYLAKFGGGVKADD